MVSAAITADTFWSGGYLATASSMSLRALSERIVTFALPVDASEHDVLRADDRDHVGDHVSARHLVQRGKVHEVGRAQLDPVRLVGAIRNDIDAELALG